MATSPTGASPNSAVPIQRVYKGCSGIRDYQIMDKLGEGTFGEVHKAKSRKSGHLFALKKILMHNEKDGFPITALREIKLLKMLSHVNVLKLEEMAVERPKGEGRKKAVLYMVTPYMDHDLSGLLDNPDVHFTEQQIKCYMLQLLEGLRYLHDSHILHRDMKAANLLINNRGILQIADFGLARHYEEDVPKPGRGGGEAHRDYTALVVTRWYRPPELLLSLRKYTTAVDMWGAGCVFGEMFKRKPILTGTSDLNQAHLIFDLVGTPNEENMPGVGQLPGCEGKKTFQEFKPRTGNLAQVFREQGSSAISLLSELLKLDWRKRINAIDALNHPYFKNDPKPARPEDIPTFQDSHELDRRNTRGHKAALPPAPAGGTVGMGPNGEHSVPPPPPGVSHPHWQNGGDRHRHAHDRPPGPPPAVRGGRNHDQGYEHRGAPRQAWQDNSRQRHHDPLRHPLPPPPGEGRHPLPNPPPAFRGGGGPERDRGPAKDTYIPSYRGERDRVSKERDELPTREVRRGSHDSRDGRPPSRDDRSRRDDYRDRDRDRGVRRTRSRSPERRDRDRRDRDRDLYRR